MTALRLAFTLDNLLHLGLASSIAILSLLLGAPALAALFAGAVALFLREATQIQSNHFHDDFTQGWGALFKITSNHCSEWLWPSVGLAVGLGVWTVVG